MTALDWTVLSAYFVVMVAIGLWSRNRIHSVVDYFTADGRVPWWLSGISHHMSGYSAVMFVAFAAVAYSQGLTVYVWWAVSIGLGVGVGAFLFAARWNRLRSKHGVTSPLEYLARRYNVPAQQVMAYSGALLKVFDIASKWVAISVLLNGFAGIPLTLGIVITGVVTLLYVTLGGIWADVLTDFGQFLIQFVAGISMLVAVLSRLGGFSGFWTVWDKLPASHHAPLTGEYTLTYLIAFFFIKTFEYNGGMWNLAQRYMAAPSGSAARRSALLSSILWLVWPFVLFFPMVAAPLIVRHVQPEQSYVHLARELLPSGIIGLVLAGFFSHTMAMISSDANAISSVITRDMLPVIVKRLRELPPARALLLARTTTVAFVVISMAIAVATNGEGVVLQIVVDLVAATMGPIAIPLMLGMLPWFRRCGSTAAIASWAAGMLTWVIVKWVLSDASQTLIVAAPLVVSLIVYTALGLARSEATPERDALIDSLDSDGGAVPSPRPASGADAAEPTTRQP